MAVWAILSEREILEKSFGISFREIQSGKNAGEMGVFYTKHKFVYFQKPVLPATAPEKPLERQTGQGSEPI